MEVKELFLKAYKNEIYADTIFNDRLHTKKRLGFRFIKPYSLISTFTKYSHVWKVFMRIVVTLWPVINFCWSVFMFIKFGIILLKTKRRKISLKGNTYLEYTRHLKNLSGLMSSENKPNQWVSLKSKERGVVTIFNLTSFTILFKALGSAIKAPFLLREITLYNHQYVLSYSSFEWFLSYYTLRQFSFKSIYYANHYDRWAIMFDSLEAESKNLIQHGLIIDGFSPPTKQVNTSCLFCYEERQKELFFKLVIEGDTCKVSYLKTTLHYTISPPSNRFSVLMVSCHPISFEREKKLMPMLPKEITLYIKPHPLFPSKDYNEINNIENVYLIDDPDDFPNVDLVISYNSTLGFNYEVSGKKVIYYEDNSVDEILEKVKEQSYDFVEKTI